MTYLKFLVLVGGIGLVQTLFAVPKDYSIEKPNVNFVAVGKPAMLKIKGKSEDLKGKITIDVDKLNANLILNLNALVTGIDTRDNHMKEKYLEVPKFPNAELTIKDLKLPAPLENIKTNQSEQAFSGELQLHGVKQSIAGTYALEVVDNKIKVTAKYNLNLTDYKIDIPSYIGIKVADKVDVESVFEIKK